MFFGVADFLLCLGIRSGQSYYSVERCARMFSFRKHRRQVGCLVLSKGQDSVRVVSPGGEGVVQCCGGDWWCGGEGGGGEDVVQCGGGDWWCGGGGVVQCGEPWW